MALLNDRVFDNGLTVLDTEADELWVCSGSETLTYATLNSQKLGTKSTPTVSSPADRSGGGREVTVSAISDGSVTASGTAALWALVDTGNTRVLSVQSLASTLAVTSGNTFTTDEATIGIPDPV